MTNKTKKDSAEDNTPTDELDVYYSFTNGFVDRGAMGFCNYFSGDPSQDDFVVDPLNPSSFRYNRIPSQAQMDRMHDLDMTFVLGLMGIWGDLQWWPSDK